VSASTPRERRSEAAGGRAALDAAYRHCEALTRRQAANFYYGIRLLPRERRRAMSACYAFARRVDDIGDGALPAEQKLLRLDAQAAALAALTATATVAASAEDPVMIALADARARFALPDDALSELVEGVRMDVDGVAYESFEQLVLYCRRVAGGIGRLCLAIFGLRAEAAGESERAQRLADDLGVALQLTNILRDLREDALNGRVYLPDEDLRRFDVLDGTAPGTLAARAERMLALLDAARADGETGGHRAGGGERERMVALVRFEAARAREWFDRGLALAGMLDRRSAACLLAMAGIYRRLLARIEQQPEDVARRRVSLPAGEKAWVAARGLLPRRAPRGVGA